MSSNQKTGDNKSQNQSDNQSKQREYVGAQEKHEIKTSGHIQSLGQGLSSGSIAKNQIGHHHYHDKDQGRNTDQNVGKYK